MNEAETTVVNSEAFERAFGRSLTKPDGISSLVQRYQRCALRILELFPSDPLPDDDPAHFYIERLESILVRDLLAAKETEPTAPALNLPSLL